MAMDWAAVQKLPASKKKEEKENYG